MGAAFSRLLTLMPGVVSVPSSGSSGQISVNGMRAEQNYFQVDGVSANTGVNTASPGRGAGYSGSVPNGTALGTTQSLVSMESAAGIPRNDIDLLGGVRSRAGGSVLLHYNFRNVTSFTARYLSIFGTM